MSSPRFKSSASASEALAASRERLLGNLANVDQALARWDRHDRAGGKAPRLSRHTLQGRRDALVAELTRLKS